MFEIKGLFVATQEQLESLEEFTKAMRDIIGHDRFSGMVALIETIKTQELVVEIRGKGS